MSSLSTCTDAGSLRRFGGARGWLMLWSLALMLALPAGAGAQSLFERLVMPGPLTAPHEKLEKDCATCHVSFSQGAQDSLCLDCHEETAADFDTATGFHGRNPEAQNFGCSHCHTDHEGRDFSIVSLDPETFDHALTDFTLVGAHDQVACANCHEDAQPFRAAATECATCHESDEPHDGALGTDCAACHTETTWSELKPFDHSTTDFTLVGGHTEVACTSCHQAEVWNGLPQTCVGCHAIQDVHDKRFGPNCDSCHSETGWAEVRFDHDTDTKFALTGAHVETECNACHTGSVETAKPGTACVECHAADDPHAGELGTDCAQCHDSSDWLGEVAFDHDLTAFPLIGIHVTVACEQCHVDTTFHAVETDCVSCHAVDDKHEAALGPDCASCHTPNGWPFWMFDHDTETDFALSGQHDGLVCEACHGAGSQPDAVETRCVSCHQDDDVHRGNFGLDCSACHGTESFKGARLR